MSKNLNDVLELILAKQEENRKTRRKALYRLETADNLKFYTEKEIREWLFQKTKELDKEYEIQDGNPDIEESIDLKSFIWAQRGIIQELMEFINENN